MRLTIGETRILTRIMGQIAVFGLEMRMFNPDFDPDVVRETMIIQIIALSFLAVSPETRIEKDLKDFKALCLWEGRGLIRYNAYNVKEDARGPAQIRPIYLQDANEWRVRMGLKAYTHMDMHCYGTAFHTVRAYWARYGLKTTQDRARGHCGGPDGPEQDCTLEYWAGVKGYL